MNETHHNGRSNTLKAVAHATLGALIAVSLLHGVEAVMADGSELDAGARVFPYNGVLELDGVAYSGLADFKFDLTGGPGCDMSEDHEDIQVYGGRFSVNIGAVNGQVPACIFDSEQVFINVSVREAADEAPHRELSGRQRIHPVPFAYWAAEGNAFRIDGGMTVNGAATFNNNVTVAAGNTLSVNSLNAASGSTVNIPSIVAIGGRLDMSGDITDTDGAVTVNDDLTVLEGLTVTDSIVGLTGFATGSSRGLELTNNAGVTLVNGTISDSNSMVTVDDGLDVNFNLNVDGDITANSNSHGTCGWTSWKRVARNCDVGSEECSDGTNAPDTNNQNALTCGNGRFMVGADFTHPADRTNVNDMWFSLYCCEL